MIHCILSLKYIASIPSLSAERLERDAQACRDYIENIVGAEKYITECCEAWNTREYLGDDGRFDDLILAYNAIWHEIATRGGWAHREDILA